MRQPFFTGCFLFIRVGIANDDIILRLLVITFLFFKFLGYLFDYFKNWTKICIIQSHVLRKYLVC